MESKIKSVGFDTVDKDINKELEHARAGYKYLLYYRETLSRELMSFAIVEVFMIVVSAAVVSLIITDGIDSVNTIFVSFACALVSIAISSLVVLIGCGITYLRTKKRVIDKGMIRVYMEKRDYESIKKLGNYDGMYYNIKELEYIKNNITPRTEVIDYGVYDNHLSDCKWIEHKGNYYGGYSNCLVVKDEDGQIKFIPNTESFDERRLLRDEIYNIVGANENSEESKLVIRVKTEVIACQK